MSKDLPDDLSQWPHDPWRLLGVARTVTPTELRRCYTMLIRRFKPERHPEEFRRIREAYERLLYLVGRHTSGTESASGGDVASPAPNSHNASESPAAREVPEDPRAVPTTRTPAPRPRPTVEFPEEKLETLWEMACGGQEADAYLEMARIAEHVSAPLEVFSRLYWLLALVPEIDSKRVPCDWLERGLRRNWHLPLSELYRREIISNQTEAMSERCLKLAASMPVSLGYVLVTLRWRALAESDHRVQTILNDLDHLRSRRSPDGDESWARLLLVALDHLVWETPQVWQPLSAELEELQHLHLLLSYQFAELDGLLEIAEQHRTLQWRARTFSNSRLLVFTSLIRRSMVKEPELLESEWRDVLRELTQDFTKGMFFLADIASDCPRVLDALLHVLANYDALHGEESPERNKALLVQRAAHYLKSRSYLQATTSQTLLEFCERERISPSEVGEVAQALLMNSEPFRELPLECMYRVRDFLLR